MSMTNKKFNIRVYGLLTNKKGQLLIADESRFGKEFTKFPGGGLEWGEGLKDCLIREFKEELGITIEVNEQFYCTDFFIASAFNKNDQLISLYYKVSYDLVDEIDLVEIGNKLEGDQEKFRWINLNEIAEETFTFPIDRLVGKLISENKDFID